MTSILTSMSAVSLSAVSLVGVSMYAHHIIRSYHSTLKKLQQTLNHLSQVELKDQLNALGYMASEHLNRTEDRLRDELNSHRERLYHTQVQSQHQQAEAHQQLREVLTQSFNRLREDITARFLMLQNSFEERQESELKKMHDVLRPFNKSQRYSIERELS
jgi:DNA anti-recombination protein RmuC